MNSADEEFSAFICGYRAALADVYGGGSLERAMVRTGIIYRNVDEAAYNAYVSPGWIEDEAEQELEALHSDSDAPVTESARRLDQLGRVYVFADHSSERVKIGFTAGSIDGRRRSIETSSGVHLEHVGSIVGTMADEARLHERFAGARIRGEWFRMTDDVREFVATWRATEVDGS